LPFDGQATLDKFETQASLEGGFQNPRSEVAMDLDRCADDLVRKRISHFCHGRSIHARQPIPTIRVSP
jgi:hypothetical protein